MCTYKLHLAACHLPDQVRVCGPSFFSLEYWIERMVQLLKRLTKYRATLNPEIIFVNGHLLQEALMRLHHKPDSAEAVAEGLEAAIKRARLALSKSGPRWGQLEADDPDADDPRVGGKAQPMSNEELAEVCPTGYTGVGELGGLPYLLYHSPELEDQGWPTQSILGSGDIRRRAITAALGLPVAGALDQTAQEGTVYLQKYMRASAAVGDWFASVQQTTQGRRDNTWCLARYDIGDQRNYYVGSIQVLVRATMLDPEGLGVMRSCAAINRPLYLAVVDMYDCEVVETPGGRPPDDLLGRPPELFAVTDFRRDGRPYVGRYVVDLDAVPCQLVPTRPVHGGKRFFATANRASGRT